MESQKRHPQEIVYCVLILEKIIASTLQYIFTDGHANSAITSIYTSADLSQIDVLISYDDIYDFASESFYPLDSFTIETTPKIAAKLKSKLSPSLYPAKIP